MMNVIAAIVIATAMMTAANMSWNALPAAKPFTAMRTQLKRALLNAPNAANFLNLT